MTDKQRTKLFLDFLELHHNSLANLGKDECCTYSELRKSIIKSLEMAYGDGKVAGFNEAQSNEDWDKTLISNKKDW